MGIRRIESATELAPEDISFTNLRIRYGTGINTSIGKGIYKKHSYRYGVMTQLGDIELHVWIQLMEQLIEKSGEQWLQNALIQWEREHNYTKSSPTELCKSALELHAARIFDNPEWIYYLPFNERYRPDVYAQAHIVLVANHCCGIPGEVTQEQIEVAYNDSICCPICGRWSKYDIIRYCDKLNKETEEIESEKGK